MLADTLTKVLALGLLALATLEVARSEESKYDEENLSYSLTLEARLLDGVKLRRGPSYVLPAGLCNVTLSPRELCGEGLVVASLEVAVRNPVGSYAEVFFEFREKHRVRVELKHCPRPWYVDLRLACLRRKPSRSHSRVPLLQDL